MPGSSPTFDSDVQDIMMESAPERLLDIGFGLGKYGDIARRINATCHVTGIDKNPVLEKPKYYDEIIVADALDYLWTRLDEQYDYITIGDCLEHMPKYRALDLIGFLSIRCKKIIIVVPTITNSFADMFQAGINKVGSEAHISIWSRVDFLAFKHDWMERDQFRLITIYGCLYKPWKSRLLVDISKVLK